VRQGEKEFSAENLDYDDSQRLITVNTESVFSNPNLIIKSQNASFNLNDNSGVFGKADFVLPTRGARGTSDQIQVATDGQQAIDYLRGTGKYWDRALFPLPGLILLDLKLPYIMGLDVLRWIRSQPGVARVVVLLSASGVESDIAAAYKLGANAFLIKPSEASKLQDMVRAIKEFWLTHNTQPPEVSTHPANANSAPTTAYSLSNHGPTTTEKNHGAFNSLPAAKSTVGFSSSL
jgi:CheY-like chemotaxis protein